MADNKFEVKDNNQVAVPKAEVTLKPEPVTAEQEALNAKKPGDVLVKVKGNMEHAGVAYPIGSFAWLPAEAAFTHVQFGSVERV